MPLFSSVFEILIQGYAFTDLFYFILFFQREKERDRLRCETLTDCLLYIPRPGMETRNPGVCSDQE